MKIDVVIKRDKVSCSSRPKPSEGISTNGQEYQSHVELESLGGAFSCGQAIAHDLKCCHVFILDEFPRKEDGHCHHPQQQNPTSLPVL